ncbi:MAG: replicative DNA helicase [Patescibacteria group bacterium]|jgi:replicative DNA helicase|nr:replicative DNA helicase [Patescibacteria group bacterium]MDD5172554.1 replicative DNA helicase [Patescibacteria group bacterium]
MNKKENEKKMEMPLAKMPPQNIEAEEALLGSLLIDKEAIVRIADTMESDDFYKDIHQMIYRAMLEVWGKSEPIDILSVSNRLEEKKQLKIIGGRSYLASLSNSVPSSSHITSYAEIVKKKSTLRKLIKSSTETIQIAYQEEDDTAEVLDKAEQKLFSISQKYLKQNFVPLKDTLTEAFERIDELHKGEKIMRGIPTGFTDLDNVLAGLQPSELIILAARPSVGKSALALDIARQAAVYQKIPVGIFSLEMSKEQISDRIICSQANVSLWKLRTGHLSKSDDDGDFEKLGQTIGTLAEAPIFIDDSPMATPIEIRTKARRLQAEHGLGLLILDYLQLMEGGAGSNEGRVQEVSQISRSLKAIARELNIPVLALSQLSRAPEARTPSIPRLADLRESGSLEQDADVVIFIYRKSMDRSIKNCSEDERNIAEIYIGKHRHGPAGGMVPLYFDNDTASFRNLEKRIDNFDLPEEETTELPF